MSAQRALRLDVRFVHGAHVREELRHHRARRAPAAFNVADHAPAEPQRFVRVA